MHILSMPNIIPHGSNSHKYRNYHTDAGQHLPILCYLAEILKKFRYVADYNGRSANRELEVLMKKHISEFEKEHDKITFD